MWVYDPAGRFYSAVAHSSQPDMLVIRSRVTADADHLNRYCQRLGEPSEVVVYERSDYPVRVITTKAAWSAYLGDCAEEVDYPNYKAHVQEHGDEPRDVRMIVLHDVWAVNLTLQNGLHDPGWDDEPAWDGWDPQAHTWARA